MGNSYFSLFDMAICGAPALAVGIWQLASVSSEIRRDKQSQTGSPENAPLPESAGHPVREHRLDDR